LVQPQSRVTFTAFDHARRDGQVTSRNHPFGHGVFVIGAEKSLTRGRLVVMASDDPAKRIGHYHQVKRSIILGSWKNILQPSQRACAVAIRAIGADQGAACDIAREHLSDTAQLDNSLFAKRSSRA